MTKLTISELGSYLPAIVLAVGCLSTYPASLCGQSNELPLKTNAISRREATGLTIEKLIDLGRLPEARAKLRQQFAKDGERPRLLLFEAMILYRENSTSNLFGNLSASSACTIATPMFISSSG